MSKKCLRLYGLATNLEVTVAHVLNSNWEGVKFRRTLRGELLDSWLKIKNKCRDVVLTVLLNLGFFSQFSVYYVESYPG